MSTTEEQIALLVSRYISNETGPEELLQLEAYMNDPEHLLTIIKILFERHEGKPGLEKSGLFFLAGGINGALLTLATGKIIPLADDMQYPKKRIASEGDIRLDRFNGGILLYSTPATPLPTVIPYNTIRTPSGGQYCVELLCGTTIWVSADAELRYPVSLTGDKRPIELTGEARFKTGENVRLQVLANGVIVEAVKACFTINTDAAGSKVRVSVQEGAVFIITGQAECEVVAG